MAYTKEQIESILNDLASRINISDELFQVANDEYMALGKWIDKKVEEDKTNFTVSIYPQGSFALGTVNKPISDEDDYDLDLVCQVENGTGLNAEMLKLKVVKPWLTGYKKTKNDIEEKRRCWHVEYEDVPSFHMDVIPALPHHTLNGDSTMIDITDKDEDRIPVYQYQGSNPKGYVKWFFDRCRQKKKSSIDGRIMNFNMAQQEDLKQNKNKTCLQKSVQLLKRHRDIMFENDPDNKPISIIITTLAGQIYSGENSILDTLLGFINGVEGYLNDRRKKDGSYSIPNPSYAGEDFADKWKEHKERQTAFFAWIQQLQAEFNLENIMNQNRVAMGNAIKKSFGAASGVAIFRESGYAEANAVKAGEVKVSTSTGNLTRTGTVTVPPNRHYGKV